MKKQEWRKLDNIWKDKVKEDADFKCEVCGKGADECQLHSHHFIGRTHTSLRWVLANGFCLCAAHHTMSRQSAHEDPQWFVKLARDLRGEKWFRAIEQLKVKINKHDFETNSALMGQSLEDIIKTYKCN
jgi:hypothetical protein